MDGLRDRTRRAVRADLAERAMVLFRERGFDETTVDDIARAAGMSKRSFFRYFATKEDAVLGLVDELGERVVEDIRARPADEPPWECLRQVLRQSEERIRTSADALRLIESTPALRAAHHGKRDQTRALIATALRDRPGSTLAPFAADLLATAAGAALDAAAREWLRTGGTADRAHLLDQAFAALRPKLA
ncbi:TetR family transcriptional regulator [Actinokineospora auranticolor]|uniref:TetR family transcriptional regulator n=1 Tax=Actinokineospora auranticolor TaxID=155976 RepID=UPI001FEB253F|nr:TetR family transcriptional regulator [Actinokineospora auranticolor]